MASAVPDSCSASAQRADEPLAGTAPFAAGWLAIEQHGPFGHDALLQSHFPRDIARGLLELLEGSGIRPALIRPVGRHADTHGNTPLRRVFLASARPGLVGMVTAEADDPAVLLEIDVDAFIAGDLGSALPGSTPHPDPVLLVCTHAKRDLCCALKGRPIAQGLASDPRFQELVWETSHLGGHRFAPTAVQLPHGWVYGQLDNRSAAEVLTSAHAEGAEAVLTHARGRSSLTGPQQAADLAARAALGLPGIDATTVAAAPRQLTTAAAAPPTAAMKPAAMKPAPPTVAMKPAAAGGTGAESASGPATTTLDSYGGPAELDGDVWDIFVADDLVASVLVTLVDLSTPRSESCGSDPKIGHVFHTRVL